MGDTLCWVCKTKRGKIIHRVEVLNEDKETVKKFGQSTTSIINLIMCEQCGTIRGEYV